MERETRGQGEPRTLQKKLPVCNITYPADSLWNACVDPFFAAGIYTKVSLLTAWLALDIEEHHVRPTITVRRHQLV